MLVAWLFTQEVPVPVDPSTWEQFGPFAICFVLMVAAIGWLLRDRTRTKAVYDADVQAHREQLDLERKANRDLYDRIIAQQDRMAPLLEQTARALDHAVERR